VALGNAAKKPRLSYAEEVERYLSQATIPDDNNFDLLGWWRRNQHDFPGLATVARVFLGISPTSSPSERAFRSGRDQIPFTRNSLNGDTLCMLMTMKSWYRKLK
jgi:hypothetical protein